MVKKFGSEKSSVVKNFGSEKNGSEKFGGEKFGSQIHHTVIGILGKGKGGKEGKKSLLSHFSQYLRTPQKAFGPFPRKEHSVPFWAKEKRY